MVETDKMVEKDETAVTVETFETVETVETAVTVETDNRVETEINCSKSKSLKFVQVFYLFLQHFISRIKDFLLFTLCFFFNCRLFFNDLFHIFF